MRPLVVFGRNGAAGLGFQRPSVKPLGDKAIESPTGRTRARGRPHGATEAARFNVSILEKRGRLWWPSGP